MPAMVNNHLFLFIDIFLIWVTPAHYGEVCRR
ncbi:hypothetical protein AFE_2073 [Acidithiobacillus ferrooxidans ATCC 23270]|uniref:Uncharacterized protein n=1 Tax=Acidithiobacillus ferrooxidans (strain ATCC 23270 / DSM 14882 / CIP 104768 / NCIMB 8455) TaxID=243159 RepID=B7J4T3_ACIF2|nr:hypothetical protein AFE_2073 [Acidithiobacillus ferrooxidans ATCC 23270]